jgi:cell division protein FtsB
MFRPPGMNRPSLFRHLRLAVLFLLALIVASVMGNRSLLRIYQMHRDRAALEREIDQLTATNATLAAEVRTLRTDPAKLEAIAREDLGLVKPGELIYEFRPAPSPPATAPPGEAR